MKELRYLASREGWKSFSEITEKSNKQIKHFADSIKQVIERGGTVSEMEKMYAQFEPQPPMSYEDFLQRYQDKLFDQFGTDEQRYFDYYDQNLDYFYGGQGSYELTIDEDCKQLGIAVGDKRLLDKAISLWEEGSKAQANVPAALCHTAGVALVVPHLRRPTLLDRERRLALHGEHRRSQHPRQRIRRHREIVLTFLPLRGR